MNTPTINGGLDPQTIAQQTVQQIKNTVEEEAQTKGMLDALQGHYETLYRNQKLYIDYLTELVDKLKDVQKADKESFSALKKEVIKHVLDSEKKKNKNLEV